MTVLPTRREIARRLKGHIRADGCIAYPRPGGKPTDRSCTFKSDPDAPDGFVVADARRQLDWRTLKDDVRQKLGLPQQSRSVA